VLLETPLVEAPPPPPLSTDAPSTVAAATPVVAARSSDLNVLAVVERVAAAAADGGAGAGIDAQMQLEHEVRAIGFVMKQNEVARRGIGIPVGEVPAVVLLAACCHETLLAYS
jgi:hypothetical protein